MARLVGNLPPVRIQKRVLPALVALALSMSCSSQNGEGSAADGTSQAATPSPSATPSSSAAAPVTAADAFFSAEFVNKPVRNEESVAASTGTYPVVIYFDEGEEQALAVTFTDLSAIAEDVPLEGFLAGTMASIAEENGGTVASQTRVQFAGTTAVDGVIEYPDGVQYVRAVLLPPGHGYTISQVAPAGAERSAEFERLLASFKHLPA